MTPNPNPTRPFGPRALAALAAVLASLLVLAACSGPTAAGPAAPTTADPTVATRAQLQAVAGTVYADLEAGDVASASDIAALFALFDVPTLDATDGAAFQSRLDSGEPFLIDFQADELAQKLSQGWLVSVASFVQAANDQGATTVTGAPLTEAYLDAALKPLLDQTSYTASELLPALVLQLGQARAQLRPGGPTDPVWGDGMLDPVQLNLLLVAFGYGSAPAPTQQSSGGPGADVPGAAVGGDPGAAPQSLSDLLPELSPITTKVIDGVGKRVFGLRAILTRWLSKTIHFPLGDVASVRASVCSSILLYGYQLTETAAPLELYAREADHPDRPDQSQIDVSLTFAFHQDINSLPKQVALFLAGCDLPPTGAASKPLAWTLTGQLPAWGSMVGADASTDTAGEAHGTFQTVDDPVPPELRLQGTLGSATGAVRVAAKDLDPKWSSLEAAVRFLNPSIGSDQAYLDVFHYGATGLELDLTSDIHEPDPSTPGGDIWDAVVAARVPLALVGAGTADAHYEGSAALTTQSFVFQAPPTCTVHWTTTDGTITVTTAPGSASPLTVTVAFPTIPYNDGTISCPQVPDEPLGPALWASGFYDLHQDEFAADAGHGTFTISGWSATGGQATKTYQRSADLYVEDTTLTIAPSAAP